MNGFELIYFKNADMSLYKKDLEILMSQGPITKNATPYIGYLHKNSNKLVSCIWIDDEDEMCMITDVNFRRMGLMRGLVSEVINDIFSGELDEVFANPLNAISKDILCKIGFVKDESNDGIWYSFSLS